MKPEGASSSEEATCVVEGSSKIGELLLVELDSLWDWPDDDTWFAMEFDVDSATVEGADGESWNGGASVVDDARPAGIDVVPAGIVVVSGTLGTASPDFASLS